MTRIRGILFDKDGTLIDHEATWEPITVAIAEHAAGGDPALRDRLLEHGGFDTLTRKFKPGTPLAAGTPPEIAATWAEVLGSQTPPDLRETIDRMFDSGGGNSKLLPGIFEALALLRIETSFLGIATSDSLAGIHGSLGHHDVLGLFDFLAGYDSGHGVKPGPGMVQAFCRATRLDPSEVAVVGDNTHDLRMGQSAGAGLKIGVLTGTSAHADLADEADLVVDSVAALPGHAVFMKMLG
ncbi:MAG: HAD family hydrolase [Hyphomicrobiaceae bacterium]